MTSRRVPLRYIVVFCLCAEGIKAGFFFFVFFSFLVLYTDRGAIGFFFLSIFFYTEYSVRLATGVGVCLCRFVGFAEYTRSEKTRW